MWSAYNCVISKDESTSPLHKVYTVETLAAGRIYGIGCPWKRVGDCGVVVDPGDANRVALRKELS